MSRTVFTGLFRTPRYAGWERETAQSLASHLITCAFPPSHLRRNAESPTTTFLLAPVPPHPASILTKLGHVVDECVSLTVSIQISQLGAAVQGQVVDAEPSLPCTAGVEQGTLGEGRKEELIPLPHQSPLKNCSFTVLISYRKDMSHPFPSLF